MSIFCYPHHINDWRRDTAHLSLEERGAYREMMDAYYATEGRLPSDRKQIYRILGVQTLSERRAVGSVIEQFFEEKDGFLFQKRCEEEIARINGKSEKAAASARAKHNKNKCVVSANAEQTQVQTHSVGICERSANQEPITNNQDKKEQQSSILPRAKPDVAPMPKEKNQAVEIIAALDEAIIGHFGAEHTRLAPNAMDRVTAQRWLDAGATVEACAGVIESVVQRQKATGKGNPPASLRYFENSIREALAAQAEPTPDLHAPEVKPPNIPPEILTKLQKSGIEDQAIRSWFDGALFEEGGQKIIVTSVFKRDWIVNNFEGLLTLAFGTTPEVMAAS